MVAKSSGHLKLDIVAGEKNPEDTLTKPLSGNPRVVRTHWSEIVATTTKTKQMMENIAMDAADRPGSLESFQQFQQSHQLQQEQNWYEPSRLSRTPEVKGSGQKVSSIQTQRDSRDERTWKTSRMSFRMSSCESGSKSMVGRLQVCRILRNGAMMEFDGRCAILEPMMQASSPGCLFSSCR